MSSRLEEGEGANAAASSHHTQHVNGQLEFVPTAKVETLVQIIKHINTQAGRLQHSDAMLKLPFWKQRPQCPQLLVALLVLYLDSRPTELQQVSVRSASLH